LQEAALESMREAVSQATPLDRNYKKTLLHDPKLSDLLQVGGGECVRYRLTD
jgi:hypothetical protein